MVSPRENDQLSAYLDGELTPQEMRSVEELLARNPEARELLAELRAQRDVLRGMPPKKAPKNLSRRVMERVNREFAAQSERSFPQYAASPPESPSERSPTARVPASDSSSLLASTWRVVKRIAQPRNLGWAIVAASIGVAIMLISPQLGERRADNELARAPEADKQSTDAQQAPPDSARKEGTRGLPRGRAVPELRAAPGSAPPRDIVDKQADRGGRAEGSPMGAAASAAYGGPGVPALGEGVAPREELAGQPGVPPSAEQPPPAAEPSSPEIVVERIMPVTPDGLAESQLHAVPAPGTPAPSPGAKPQIAEPLEIICDISQQKSLESMVAQVVRSKQGVEQGGEVIEEPWELAANRQDVAEGGGTEQPEDSAGGKEAGPDFQIQFRKQEQIEEAVIEFSATLAQVQGVLRELGADQQVVQQIKIPAGLPMPQELQSLAAEGRVTREGAGQPTRRAMSAPVGGAPAQGLAMAPAPSQAQPDSTGRMMNRAAPQLDTSPGVSITAKSQQAAVRQSGQEGQTRVQSRAPQLLAEQSRSESKGLATRETVYRIRVILRRKIDKGLEKASAAPAEVREPAAPASTKE